MSVSRNVRFVVAYRGTHFHGFAPNEGVRTVGGALRDALEQVLGEPLTITVAGRTDAGVHAQAQVVSFTTSSERFDGPRLEFSLNRLCAPDIVVRDVTVVDDDFDARFSATGRRYEYTVFDGSHLDPLRAELEWHVPAPLDLDALQRAANHVVGEHDFTSFCRRPKDRPDASLVRRVGLAEWRRGDDGRLRFTIEANAFCHQMVRALVGFCVAAGRHRVDPDAFSAIIAARDRQMAPPIAPPHGLVLAEVSYD